MDMESVNLGKRKRTDQLEPTQHILNYSQGPVTDTPMSFGAVENYEKYFKNSGVQVERALDYEKASKKVVEVINHYSWSKLVEIKPEKYNLTRLKEFYAVISDFESDKDVTEISLRDKTISFTPKDINKILKCLDVDENELYSVKWNLEDKQCSKKKALECQRLLCPNTEKAEKRFGFGDAGKDVKEIKHLIGYNILPSMKISAFSCKEACLTLAIWEKEPIDIGKLIHKRACNFAIKRKIGRVMPYPFLIDALCRDAGLLRQQGDEDVVPKVTYLGRHVKTGKKILPETRSEPIPIDSTVASSSSTNEVAELRKDMIVLNTNMIKVDANMTDFKNVVIGLNNNVVSLIRGFIGMNDNMEILRKSMFENLRQFNDNMMQGYNNVSTACEVMNKKIMGIQNFDLVRDHVHLGPQAPISSPSISVNTPILQPSILGGFTIPILNNDGEPSRSKTDEETLQPEEIDGCKLNALATVAWSFHSNQ